MDVPIFPEQYTISGGSGEGKGQWEVRGSKGVRRRRSRAAKKVSNGRWVKVFWNAPLESIFS